MIALVATNFATSDTRTATALTNLAHAHAVEATETAAPLRKVVVVTIISDDPRLVALGTEYSFHVAEPSCKFTFGFEGVLAGFVQGPITTDYHFSKAHLTQTQSLTLTQSQSWC